MITIGYSTKEHKQDFINYLKKSAGYPKVQIIEKINKGDKSLSSVYNEIIDEAEYDIVLLIHDDIYFDSKNWFNKLKKHFEKNNYAILGVAGTSYIPETGRWWDDRSKMVGIVNHENKDKKWESKYSKSFNNDILDVCLIDGVFMCIHKNRIKVKFNEEIKGFHFYDVNFCVENYLEDCEIGVITNVRITHKSIGQTNEKWEERRLEFIDKYNDILPIKLIPNINYEPKQHKNYKIKNNIKYVVQTTNESELNNFIENISKYINDNVSLALITTPDNHDNIEREYCDKYSVFEGHFDELQKNLSVLRWDEDFMLDSDELFYFSYDTARYYNDPFKSTAYFYNQNKGRFGCIFPTSVNEDKSIFSNRLDLVLDEKKQVFFWLKDAGNYYNILEGLVYAPYGNLSELLITTKNNLEKFDWFDLGIDSLLIFNDFAAKCTDKDYKVFVNTDLICTQSKIKEESVVEEDLKKFLGKINDSDNLKKYLKISG